MDPPVNVEIPHRVCNTDAVLSVIKISRAFFKSFCDLIYNLFQTLSFKFKIPKLDFPPDLKFIFLCNLTQAKPHHQPKKLHFSHYHNFPYNEISQTRISIKSQAIYFKKA